ncbi:MAG TPA: hypothetical protein VG939_07400 [Caulobacteraceae bacterium]|nr:hypothetical protein [Caulobacteraceae bacterium]
MRKDLAVILPVVPVVLALFGYEGLRLARTTHSYVAFLAVLGFGAVLCGVGVASWLVKQARAREARRRRKPPLSL